MFFMLELDLLNCLEVEIVVVGLILEEKNLLLLKNNWKLKSLCRLAAPV